MNVELMNLANDLYAARLKQAKAKEKLLAAERDHEQAKASAYLRGGPKEGHYEANYRSTIDPKVQSARAAVDAATIGHYEAWIEANHRLNLLSVNRPGHALERDDWINNKP